jgi:acetoin utilization deacetylase AcuC-like enzyme
MKVFHADRFTIPLPEGHRFPLATYPLLRQRVSTDVPGVDLAEPEGTTDLELEQAHTRHYVRQVTSGDLAPEAQRRMGFPWSPELVERARRSAGATLAASRAALEDGISASLAGGTHHAFAERGEGFCVFNDVGVTARTLQAAGLVRRVLVIDLDVHQGNGTAAMFAGDDSVFTLDVYAERNYPFTKQPPDLAAPLADRTGDAEYLAVLEPLLTQGFTRCHPDLVIYLAGADPYQGDRLGRLSLTQDGLAARDGLVLQACRSRQVPVAITMAGGYGRRLEDTVDIHLRTIQTAASLA